MRTDKPRSELLIGLVVSVTTLIIIECAARVVTTIRQDLASSREPTRSVQYDAWAVYSPTVGWKLKPNFEGDIGGAARRFDADGFQAVDSAQIGDFTQYRIVFVGDSNTFGHGVTAESAFSEVVDELLPDAVTINLGVPGYSSYQGRVVLEEAVSTLRPDLVVISFNFNDRRYVVNEALVDGATHFRRMYELASQPARDFTRPFESVHTFLALRFVMRSIGIVPARAEDSVLLDTLRPRVDEAAYRENLLQMAKTARDAGVAVMFLLLKDNPVESFHTRQGIMHFRTGAYERAVRHLVVARAPSRNAVTAHFGPLASIYLADAYRALEADPTLIQSVLTLSTPSMMIGDGGGVVRLDTDYNEIMREAADRADVPLVDATTLQDEHWETFIDACHFDAKGHRLVGELLARSISKYRTDGL